MVRGIHEILAQNESCGRETDEAEGSQETEDTVDEDSNTAISICVVTEFGDKSPRDLLNCWFEFLSIFYLE